MSKAVRSGIGIAVLALGIVWAFAMVGKGVDFPVLYVMTRGLLDGTNVYTAEVTAAFPRDYDVSPSGMYYPPATGLALLPLGLLPYAAAKWTFAAVTILVVVWGIRGLVKVARPTALPQVWMIVAGVVLVSSAMRWGLMLLQVAPLVFGLLCWFLRADHEKRDRAALGLTLLAMWLKMTLAAPFLAVLVLRRRWFAAVLVVSSWLLLNIIGFWRMGPDSFREYQRSVTLLGELGYIDSPDLWRSVALPRLDWVALFYSLTMNLRAARVLSFALTGVCGAWLLRQTLRNWPAEIRITSLFVGAFVCLGSLAVYHHQYDAVLFLAPMIAAILTMGRTPRLAGALLIPLLLITVFLPIGQMQGILVRTVGTTSVGLLKLSLPAAVTLALLGWCLLIRQAVREPLR
jgi:hypothetical protein